MSKIKPFKPGITHFKILLTVKLLNDQKYYPLPEGLTKILSGVNDDETKEFVNIPTFQTILSYSSKKISRYVLMLLRYRYLTKILDRETNELYLRITPLGVSEIEEYQQKHRVNLKKHDVVKKPTIVKID